MPKINKLYSEKESRRINQTFSFCKKQNVRGKEASSTLQKCWKHANHIEIDAKGAAGGLAIMWNPSTVLLGDFFTSKWTITASFRLIGSNKSGYITNAYGPATPGDKDSFLKHLDWLADHINPHRWI
jgi:hypothetical protein